MRNKWASDQTHVVMPARPTTGLVVRQAERSLGLFEELLHLKTRGGNQSERLEAIGRRNSPKSVG